YAKSEQVVRHLEQRHGLTALQPSSRSARGAPKKNEVEMALRTDTLSHKMALQRLLGSLLDTKGMTLTELIARGEQQGIYFLFNKGANGRISGITYFYEGFKITGKKLGNRFKWNELIKQMNYEQNRESMGVIRANERTQTRYGSLATNE